MKLIPQSPRANQIAHCIGFGVFACFLASGAVAQHAGPANEAEARHWPAARTIYPAHSRVPDQRPALRAPGLDPAGLQSIIGSATGLRDNGEELRGMAPRYETVFGDRYIRFYPSLGVQRDIDYSIRFELESIGRSSGGMRGVTTGHRVVEDRTVRYVRSWFDEVYDIDKDAMEQSFVFRSLPAGSGDLIVRYRVKTLLEPTLHGTSADGMEFRLPGAGGAKIGGVIGIDANGVKRAGSMRYDDGLYELILPGDFVESAALPLVLDPPIGSIVTVAPSPNVFDQGDPDVAFDATNNQYLCVWEREVASTFQIRGVLLDTNGAVVSGGVIGVNTSTRSKIQPRCARAASNRIAVCWVESFDIRGTGVHSGTGAVFSTTGVDIATGTDARLRPDIGGDVGVGDNDAIVVWQNLATNEIEARQLQISISNVVNAVGPIVNITTASGGGGTSDLNPAISKSGGSSGNHLIVYRRNFSTDSEIRGIIVDRNINVIDPFISITSNGVDDLDPACDGDGQSWVVAFERDEVASPADQDIICRGVFLNAAGTQGLVNAAEVAIEANQGDDEVNPTVAWAGDSALVGFADEVVAPDYDAYVRSIDPFSCETCEGEFLLEFGTRDSDLIAIATEFSGRGTGDSAMFVWDSADGGSEVRGRLFRVDDGIVTEEGGGCGEGGRALANCAGDGNANFAHRLRGAAPNSTAVLLFSFDRIDANCGPCTLVPNPFTGLGFGASTDANGNAEVPMAIPVSPNLEGVTFIDQWLVATPTRSCSIVGVDMSSAISVEIQ